MAEQFVGMTVALSLSNHAQLKGTVSKVDSTTQILHLRDVYLPDGALIPNYSVEASHIVSLEIVSAAVPQLPESPVTQPAPEFHDPAILSFSRKPQAETKKTVQASQPEHPPPMIRTSSKPKATPPPLPDLNALTINSEVSTPGPMSHPSIIRPKPRKPPQPSIPPHLQPPNSPRQRRSPHVSRQRRRAHSRVSDSGFLTDEIIGGHVDDFDFEENLGKFDKRRDWEEFKKMDNTDPTSLLVYHNRKSTAPKYIPHKTNVLDERESTDDNHDENRDDEGTVNRRASRHTRRGTMSRKASGFTTTGSISGRNSVVGARWKVVGEENKGEIVTMTAEQMANAEKLALETGMSEDVLIENAARGIAEVVLASFGTRLSDSKNHNPAPLVVVLAGNNRTGAYSLGAGRWLSTRGIRVLSVVCAGEEEELDAIRTQSKLFKNAGGRKVVPEDLQRTIAALPSPPEIILDGLFGYLHSLDDIWDDEDKVTCVQLIKWANSLRGRRISIDKPSVAKSVLDDDVDLIVAAEWIVEVGALKDDLAVEKGERVFVVDLGLGKNVWRGVSNTGSGKKKMGINWNGKWVVEVEIVV